MARSRDTAFFGHPIGLATLFFTEMWERFSFYGIRALLIIYMTTNLAKGGLGMEAAAAGVVMGVYTASVYLLSLPGGWVADRFLGQRRATMLGGIGIAGGNALLAAPTHSLFFPGLVLIALGTGLLKPNISTIVGQLYKANDIRRDGGYTIYYMGINVGALVAPLVCGFFAQTDTFQGFLAGHGIDPTLCWHFGFGAASVGMVLGVIQYALTQNWLGEAGKEPTVPSDPRKAARDRYILGGVIIALAAVGLMFAKAPLAQDTIGDIFAIGLGIFSIVLLVGVYAGAQNADERRRVIAIVVLFIGAIAFFGVFEQAATTLSLFAQNNTSPRLLWFDFPAAWYQSVNSVFIIALAPGFAAVWLALGKRKKEPTSPMKFAIGMALIAVSFVVMLPTSGAASSLAAQTAAGGSKSCVEGANCASGLYLIALYFFSTCSELCISPVGLSSMSRLAPKRMAGMVMGIWFLGASNGEFLAGRATAFSSTRGYAFLFEFLIAASLVIAAALFFVSPIIRRMMAASQPEAEPEPPAGDLPAARVVSEG
jgi:POT family proton-dependent oligopeptide transporter